MEGWNIAITIIASIFGGGALLTLLQFLISRHDKKHDKTEEVMKEIKAIRQEIKDLKEDLDEHIATNARVRILQFSDECRHGLKHSKESFDQVHQDIDYYNAYCRSHPDYENSRAVAAIEHIRAVYTKCLANNDDFLD